MERKPPVKFIVPLVAQNEIDFVNEIKEKVRNYTNNLPNKGKGDYRLFLKTLVIFLLLCESYLLILFPVIYHSWIWLSLAYCQMGFVLALIGFNVMHDASHGSYSKNKTLNLILSYSLNLIGGNIEYWHIKHDEDHHIRTNIIGYDEDVEIYPALRTYACQKPYWIHKFQHMYAWLVYLLAGFFIVHVNDFRKFFKKALGSRATPTTWKSRVVFILSKGIHFYLFVGIPAHVFGWTTAWIGYIIMVNVTGCIMSIVFQLAHLFKATKIELILRVPHKWEVYQLLVTADFAVKSKIASWILGGLNFQAIHHIFSDISHIHYPVIQKIVKALARKHGITYYEFPTIWSAWKSHLAFLKMAGNESVITSISL